MDLETENRIAAILLKEAAELRRQAQSEGALAYLREPTVRSRPNSRFLTATVRGVQQGLSVSIFPVDTWYAANRVVEVNEMWRLRQKQLELESRLRARNGSSDGRGYKDVCESHRSRSRGGNEMEKSEGASLSSKKRLIQDLKPMEDEGLRDDEVDEFLHSRSKRGRGAVGSRMDETGPYLPSCPDTSRDIAESPDEEPKKARVLLGPKKPYSLKSSESSDDESDKEKKRKSKACSSKRHSRKHKSKEKSRDKKKKRKEKRSKYDK
ncbi:arginine/serine-rich coiled-coil protein 2 isoform X1 [Sesamum indicum]|uniref:Arginine/serine-rich coiled-coil protein 2 isoform X1 n=1 Tax=Sesamum indicum TaxID=4182 RepID=A0A6I9TQM3_SESIN|nr:arginine/serine-rich coiled-coil protein 2 isoform X1 [Sesamum indicum]